MAKAASAAVVVERASLARSSMSEISQAGWRCLTFYGFSMGFPVEDHGVVIRCYNRCLAGVGASLDF